jgi:DNA-binding CsgD family transcriptional regulator
MNQPAQDPAKPSFEKHVQNNHLSFNCLSTRESQILALLASGYVDKEIAAELAISINTLRTYFRRIRTKLGNLSRSVLAVEYSKFASNALVKKSVAEFQPDWEVDLTANRITFLSERDLPHRHLDCADLEQLIQTFEPEDQVKIREILSEVRAGLLDSFLITGRLTTPSGPEEARGYCRVVKNRSQVPVKVQGMRIQASISLTFPNQTKTA